MIALDLLKTSRSLAIASMLALASVTAAGCSGSPEEAPIDDGRGASADDITSVDHTAVKRQSIGNCWLYATASWLEALNKAATGEAANTSESWLTYWHWYEELTNGNTGKEIETGGSFRTGEELIERYGLVLEGDFIGVEADAEMSARQARALATLNTSLTSGSLKDAVARGDKRAIRAELDGAWGLDAETIARIDTVFGDGVTRTLDRSAEASARAAANKIIRAKDFPARLLDPESGSATVGTLQDAMGQDNSFSPRTGKFAWAEVSYPRGASDRRAFWKRVQRALHDGQPVVTAWKIDFNALSRASVVSLDELKRRGPGKQGGHLTVMHDYQAQVPGLGLLKAGEDATPDQMKSALADGTVIEFVRVKNSWGGIRPDRWDDAAIPGYHDLEMGYLNGPIQSCVTKPDGTTDTTKCDSREIPLRNVVLPAGY